MKLYTWIAIAVSGTSLSQSWAQAPSVMADVEEAFRLAGVRAMLQSLPSHVNEMTAAAMAHLPREQRQQYEPLIKDVSLKFLEPEAFYHYDAELPNANGEATLTTAPGQPLPQAAVPEEVYSYTATPEPREPVVASNVIPPPPTVEPEVRFAYTPTPEPPSLVPRELVVPSLPMFEGWTGLRLPGRVIRYITQ